LFAAYTQGKATTTLVPTREAFALNKLNNLISLNKEARMAHCDAAETTRIITELDTNYLSPYTITGGTRNSADIMGVQIDCTHRDRVLAQIEDFVQSGLPHQIVTVNVDFLNIVHRDPSFVHVLNEAAVSVPDGMPLVWISRLVGKPLPERITGTDLIYSCAELAAQRGYRIFLLGAAPGVADEAAAVLQGRYPGVNVVGTYSPPACDEFTPEEDAHILQLVRAARPDMLFVALGTPKQEKWIYQHLQDLGVPVCIGVGGVFNFITGRIPRAPEGWQQAGLEWLFRLLLEPRRLWRRYLVDDTRALSRALLYAMRQGSAPRPAAPPSYPLVPVPVPVRPLRSEHSTRHLSAMEATVASSSGVPVQTGD
jgi:N-acetylglucosaminyldiphosphoundecaprenol N-acetyl-beta-D-mannosaminyltransferase